MRRGATPVLHISNATEPSGPPSLASASEIERLVRYDWPVYSRHGKVTRFAKRLGMTAPQLRELVAGTVFPSTIQWQRVSDETMRTLLEAFAASSENISRFASRHGYASASLSAALRDRFGSEFQVEVDRKAVAPGNRYRLGADLERRCVKTLRAQGFYVVRSPASAGAADLVAMRPEVDLLVQCKRAGVLPLDEWNGLVEAAATAGALPVLVENPHAGLTSWWHLLGPRVPGTPGQRRPLNDAIAELATRRACKPSAPITSQGQEDDGGQACDTTYGSEEGTIRAPTTSRSRP